MNLAEKLLREALRDAEWRDKIIYPFKGEEFQNWKLTVYLPVSLSETDKSPEAALERILIDNDTDDELRRLREAHDWQYKMAGERLRRIEADEILLRRALEVLNWLHEHGFTRDGPSDYAVADALRERLGEGS